MLICLFEMRFFSCLCHCSLLTLVLPVFKDLLASDMLLLQSPQAFFFFFALFLHLHFFHLLGALEQNLVLLILVESLEMVRLDSVRGEHALLCGGVFCHEFICQSVTNFVRVLI